MSRKAIKDEFTDLPISRQRKWQMRKQKAGLCIICGQPSDKERCSKHSKPVTEHAPILD